MRVILIGTVEFSKKALQKLIDLDANIVGVITKEQSSYNSDYANISSLCEIKDISFIYSKDINNDMTLNYIRNLEPDIIFCFGWSQLLKNELLNIPRLGVIGYHPALLPQNRGRHPIIWALVLGLEQTGSTFFFINEGTDSGDIISQKHISINYEDDARSLYDKITSVAMQQIEAFYPQLIENNISRIKQDNNKSNYWRKRNKKDGYIDWRMSSNSIYNLVRALTKPYPGASFFYNNKEIKVWNVREVKIQKYNNIEPGKILKVYNKGSFLVKTGTNCIEVLECDLKNKLMEGDYL